MDVEIRNLWRDWALIAKAPIKYVSYSATNEGSFSMVEKVCGKYSMILRV